MRGMHGTAHEQFVQLPFAASRQLRPVDYLAFDKLPSFYLYAHKYIVHWQMEIRR